MKILKFNEATELKSKRVKGLSEEEFLDILRNNCKNFSFENDLLWRSKKSEAPLQLFEPEFRSNTNNVLAFPDFFNKIENDDEYPVARKKSLIGCTKKELSQMLVCDDVFLVIPFDDSEIVFCPAMDLWALADNRRAKEKLTVGGREISKEHFVKTTYTKGFKIPFNELLKIPNNKLKAGNYGDASEFFISNPCLLIHESKIAWLKENI